MSRQKCIALGSLLAGTAVVLGAFGAHALKDRLEAGGYVATWETAVQYHMWHALAILLVAALTRGASEGDESRGTGAAPWAFLLGVLAFSGSLYGLALGGPRWLGPVTPLGGVALIVGWILVLVRSLRSAAR